MGNCSSLFFNSASDNETLHTRISLLPEQITYAKEKKDDLLDTIKPGLQAELNVPIGHWLQGSYKNHTVIRPIGTDDEFDIDVGLYLLCNAESHQITADLARESVRDELIIYADSDGDAIIRDPKSSCERTSFENQFHLDIPVYYFDEKTDTCRLATLNNEWVASDPKKLQDWFDGILSGLDKENTARLRRMIRYTKCWAGLNSTEEHKRLPSVAITVLIANFYKECDEDDDSAIHIFNKLIEYFTTNSTVQNPIDGADLLQFSDDDLQHFDDRLNILHESISQIQDSSDSITTYINWSNIFNEYFPPYCAPQVKSIVKSTLPVHTTPPQIRVDHRQKDNKTNVSNQVMDAVKTFKKEHLYFSINNASDYAQDATVKWIVRNKDTEANLANDLGHSTPTGIRGTQYERCSYRGRHYMECIVLENHMVRGYASVEVKVQGFERPIRNPPKRKIYRGPR